MNKQNLINAVSSGSMVPPSVVEDVLNSYMDVVKDCMRSGESICVSGFGSFSVKMTKEKKARNIHTGETVIVPERKKVKFKALFEL